MLRILAVAVFVLHMQPKIVRADSNAAVHVAASAGLTAGLYLVMSAFTGREKKLKEQSLWSAAAFAVATGVAKECMDSMSRGDRRIDRGDITANLAGVAAASVGVIAIDF